MLGRVHAHGEKSGIGSGRLRVIVFCLRRTAIVTPCLRAKERERHVEHFNQSSVNLLPCSCRSAAANDGRRTADGGTNDTHCILSASITAWDARTSVDCEGSVAQFLLLYSHRDLWEANERAWRRLQCFVRAEQTLRTNEYVLLLC